MGSDITNSWGERLRGALPWLFGAVLIYLVGTQLYQRRLVSEGSVAPQLAAELSDGTSFQLAQHQGHVVVVNFWASWCPPCRAEAPVLSRAHGRLKQQGGLVVGISTEGANLASVAQAATRLQMNYPVALATQQDLERYRVQSLPTTYVISPDGKIARAFVGAVSDDELADAIAEAGGTT